MTEGPWPKERILFQDNFATITTARAVLHGTTYALASITSVTHFTQPGAIGCPIFFMVVGIVGGAWGIIGGATLGWIAIAVGALCGVWAHSQRHTKHWVRLGIAGAEVDAVWSLDKRWTAKVASAINEAIVARG